MREILTAYNSSENNTHFANKRKFYNRHIDKPK